MSAIETPAGRWRYAIKPASWPKLLVPTLLGQVLGMLAAGGISLAAFGLGVLFTLLNGTFIVLINDWGDREVDAVKRRMFPDGCSPKTIPDGILPARQLLAVGLVAGIASIAVAFLLGHILARPALGPAGVLCVLTFVAYSLGPLKLNYRGGGEGLEAFGVGLLLPWFHAHAQSGLYWVDEWWLLGGFVALALASALASGLSDEESDRAGGKRTVAVARGNTFTRHASEALVILGATLWLVSAWLLPALSPWVMVPAVLVVLGFWLSMLNVSPQAVTGAFAAQAVYKQRLHRASGLGVLALLAGLLVALTGGGR